MKRLALPPFVALYCIVAMIVLDRLCHAQWWSAPIAYVGWLFVVGGLAVAQWHAGLFKRIGTNINTFDDPNILTRAGLFEHTRNPMYLGMLTLLLGVAIVLGSLCAFVPFVAFFLLAQYWYIPVEERALHRVFGQRYVDYCRAVRRWL